MTFQEFREIGVRSGVPLVMIRLTWILRPEYQTCPSGEDKLLEAMWDYALKHMPPLVYARIQRLDAMNVSEDLLVKVAQGWKDDQFVKAVLGVKP